MSLIADPNQPTALHMQGVQAMASGRFQAGIGLLQQALEVEPAAPRVMFDLTRALLRVGRTDEALVVCDRLLKLDPADAHAWNHRGNALLAQNRPLEALDSFAQATQLDSRLAAAHHGRGMALNLLHRPDEALAAFDAVISIKPRHVDALLNRGNTLRDLGRPTEALESYERALAADPDCIEAACNRGNALLDSRLYAAAIDSYTGALLRQPDHPDILANRAAAFQELGEYDSAAADLERLVRIAPQYNYALGNLLQVELQVCDWAHHSERVREVELAVCRDQKIIHPFSMMNLTSSAAMQLRAANLHASGFPSAEPFAQHTRTHSTDRKLRIAYVSADLREHAVSYLMAGIFEHHDRSEFELIALSLSPPERSAMGERVVRSFDRFVDVSKLNDREVVTLARQLQVDIAVDLMGYTHKARPGVLGRGLAPVQVNYLGYPGTLGAPFAHYIIADKFLIPPQSVVHYAEDVVYLPGCFQANDDRCVAGVQSTRASQGLPDTAVVFCCFNSSYKLNPATFDVWMRVLDQVRGSVLWLLGEREDVRSNLRAEARARAVDPDRLFFASKVPYAEHLGRLSLADLFLDTFPYNAGTTASDALRSGLPVLTCAGEAYASRMAGSLLTAVDLPDLITYDLEEYANVAIALGRQPERLRALRARLSKRGPGVPFDTAAHCRHLESAFRVMHQQAVSGEQRCSFAVASQE